MSSSRFQNVLLIDDNEITNAIQSQLIKTSGFADTIVMRQSGIDALEYLRNKVTEANVPEIIFLDIRMPVIDGFGFLEEYKKLPAYITDKAKVVMLTSSLDDSDRAKSKSDSHVSDFIVKPLTIDKLNALEI